MTEIVNQDMEKREPFALIKGVNYIKPISADKDIMIYQGKIHFTNIQKKFGVILFTGILHFFSGFLYSNDFQSQNHFYQQKRIYLDKLIKQNHSKKDSLKDKEEDLGDSLLPFENSESNYDRSELSFQFNNGIYEFSWSAYYSGTNFILEIGNNHHSIKYQTQNNCFETDLSEIPGAFLFARILVPERDYSGPKLYFTREDFQWSYFSKNKTVNLSSDLPSQKVLKYGENLPGTLYIVSDMGKYIISVNSEGQTKWIHRANHPRSICVYKNLVYYSTEKSVCIVSADSGTLLKTLHFSNRINYFHVDSQFITICFSSNSKNNVVVYQTTSKGFLGKKIYTCPFTINYPRAAKILNHFIVIADSFNCRVLSIDMTDSRIKWVKKVYFPADIEIYDKRIYLCEEHTNRITSVNFSGKDYQFHFGSPHPFFRDLKPPPDFFRNYQFQFPGSSIKLSNRKEILGASAQIVSGINTLYSPNGFLILDSNSMLIADTDNHRIVWVKDSKVQSIIYNINNPVKLGLKY